MVFIPFYPALSGFLSHRATPSHPLEWDFPFKKPSSYGGTPFMPQGDREKLKQLLKEDET